MVRFATVLVLLLLVAASAAQAPTVEARPDGTDGSGFYTCRTDCPRWGHVTGARHSHREPSGPARPPRSANSTPHASAAPTGSAVAPYTLIAAAASTFVVWRGPDATSAVFEAVPNLEIVWKWAGDAWVGYVSDPAAPNSVKPDFSLSAGDILWVVSTGAVILAPGAVTPQAPVIASLERVIDGDTIEVIIGGTRESVRLIGIDTPERGQPGASEATARVEALLAGGRVYLEADVRDRDRYDRLLRYVWTNDEGRWSLVNLTLVAEGLAGVFTVPPDERHVERLRGAETTARAEGRGLWR